MSSQKKGDTLHSGSGNCALSLYQEENGIALITLNRPEAIDALNMDVLQRLSLLLDHVRTRDSVKALIITGAGDAAFSAGADIKLLNRATHLAVRDFARLAIGVNHKIETLGKVVLAAINGYALSGGLELAERSAFSIHDLSRSELSEGIPRFNMPVQLGLALYRSHIAKGAPRVFVFESKAYPSPEVCQRH